MEIGESAIAKRRLMLRDAVTILTVLLITGVLFAITLFLFRSFSAHRGELAQRWAERGRRALETNRPAEAIADFRTALSYAPGTRSYELLLAEALGHAGRTDESFNYFLGLWDTAPGNGNINLALARLAAQKGERALAVNYYRAAIYGSWEQGGGVERRAAVRAELARYLIDQHDFQGARMELLVAGGNLPDSYERSLTFGRLLEAAQDPKDAEMYYQKAIAAQPNDPTALEAAGRLAYAMADYATAHRLLDRAADERVKQHAPEAAADSELAHNAARLLELNPAPSLPPRERVGRVITIRSVAKKRFEACKARRAPSVAATLESLETRWAGPDGTSNVGTLLRDPARQDAALQLAFDTERQTQTVCGTSTGDDALLFRLASSSKPGGQAE